MPSVLLSVVASFIVAVAGEVPSEEVVSLVQTRLDDEMKPLLKPRVKLDLDDAPSVKKLADHFRTLQHDIAISLDVNGPKVMSQVTKADLSKCQELTSQLDAHLADLKSTSSGTKSKSHSPKLSGTTVQQFQSSVEKRLYGPENEVVHLIATNKALCMEGPTHYMKNVLVRLRGSPVVYGWDQRTHLDYGECRKSGFHRRANSTEGGTCFPKSSTWLHQRDRHSYADFSKEMMKLWAKKQGKTMEDAYKKMKGTCLKE